MKNEIKKTIDLIYEGFSFKTISKLDEKQINLLHKKFISEQVMEVPSKKTYKVGPKGGSLPPNPKGYSVRQDPNTKDVYATAQENEMAEQADTEVSSFNKSKGGTTQDPTQVMAPDGMDDLSDEDIDKEKDITEKKQEKNPWAICTSQLGKEFKTTERSQWSPKQKTKYERCVKDVKKSLTEEKNPVSLFLENQIIKIVERNLPPRITKKDLIKYLTETAPAKPKPSTKPSTKPKPKPKPERNNPFRNPRPGVKPEPKANLPENGPAVAPSKPKPTTKPTTKPGKPRTKPEKPNNPFRNPRPEVKPEPKAVSPEKAKDEVIDLILNLLQK